VMVKECGKERRRRGVVVKDASWDCGRYGFQLARGRDLSPVVYSGVVYTAPGVQYLKVGKHSYPGVRSLHVPVRTW
jgi:hypothetical protein